VAEVDYWAQIIDEDGVIQKGEDVWNIVIHSGISTPLLWTLQVGDIVLFYGSQVRQEDKTVTLYGSSCDKDVYVIHLSFSVNDSNRS
jgi:hypothetical protein